MNSGQADRDFWSLAQLCHLHRAHWTRPSTSLSHWLGAAAGQHDLEWWLSAPGQQDRPWKGTNLSPIPSVWRSVLSAHGRHLQRRVRVGGMRLQSLFPRLPDAPSSLEGPSPSTKSHSSYWAVGATMREAGETPSLSLSSILKTEYELGLNSAQEWANHC